MPFETPPGQLLSSIPPCSSDRKRSAMLGGCAGVLFQIFHGKRWLPRKSLPAERLNPVACNHTDDKLPIAKLLLIADENRVSSLRDGDELFKDETVENIEFHEENGPRRTPGVVARLMGLESMPSPKIVFVESKQAELHKNADSQVCIDNLQKGSDTSTVVVLPQPSLPQRANSGKLRVNLPREFAMSQRKQAQDCSSKSEALPNILPSSCHQKITSFPSAAKVCSSKKNCMSAKKPAHRIEVAPRLLKNDRQNDRSGSQRLHGSFSGAKPSFLHAKGNLTNLAAGVSRGKQDEGKRAQDVSHTFRNERSHNEDSQKLRSGQQHTRKFSSHEATFVKSKNGFQQRQMERQKQGPKTMSMEKSRPDLRRQDELRRLSQPTVSSMNKSQVARATRHLSPPKSFQDSNAGDCSCKASICVPSSSERTMPSQLTQSYVESNDVTARKQSSSTQGSSLNHEHAECQDRTKLSPVADSGRGNMMLMNGFSASPSAETGNNFYSEFDHDGSTSSAIYTESLQRSSLESSISSDPSLSELTLSSEECSYFSLCDTGAGHEREEEKQKDDLKMLRCNKSTSDFSSMESCTESLSESLTLRSAGAEIHAHSECAVNANVVDSVCTESLIESLTLRSAGEAMQAHSECAVDAIVVDPVCTYSVKNTAAILQELLTALSSSTAQRKLTFDRKSEGAVSCTMYSEIGRLESLPDVNVQCSNDVFSESLLQDSVNFTSADRSQLLKGNEECELDNSNNDCAVINEVQPQAGDLEAVSGHKHTNLQNVLSRDCEELMNMISKLHQIEPESIGLKATTVNDRTHEEVLVGFKSRGADLGLLPDSDCFDKPEVQTQWTDCGLLSLTTLTAEDDADNSTCRSDFESSFRNGYDEVAIWSKKLVTDCVDEAFKSLSKQIYKFSSSLSEPPSATHLLNRVYMQLDEWRGMALSMNLDIMMEKEMNLTARIWQQTNHETEEVAEVVQTTIFSRLLEEVLLELI